MPRDEKLLATAGDWLYVSCRCIVEVRTPGVTRTSEGGVCQLCGNGNVKFIHSLEYLPDIDANKPEAEVRRIDVGLDCARLLVEHSDEHVPVLAENEAHRKRRWRIHYRRLGWVTVTPEDLDVRGKL